MKILIFSDIHGDMRALEQVVSQPADIYIAAGDLSTFGRVLDRCAEVLQPLAERLWLLPGNHESHAQTRDICGRFGFFDFHRKVQLKPLVEIVEEAEPEEQPALAENPLVG